MKQMRKLFLAVAMLAVSAVMMVTSSYAWFSMSTEAEITGMAVNATADSSLMISPTNNTFVGQSLIKLEGEANVLNALTCNKTSYQYEYPADNDAVDQATGAFTGTMTPLASENGYYVDYVVYVASSANEMTKNLTATVTFTPNSTVGDTYKATTVAFYVLSEMTAISEVGTDFDGSGTVEEDEKQKYTIQAGKPTAVVAYTDSSLVAQLGSLTIPVSTTAAIPVVMRIYFDGAAAAADGIHYVRSSSVNESPVTVNVKFNAN